MAFDFRREYRALYQPGTEPEIVTVPAMNAIAVEGRGDPNEPGGAYQQAVAVLYAVAYTIRMSGKSGRAIDGFFEYVVPPLEGFWQRGAGEDKSAFRWTAVIRLPDFVTRADFDWAVAEASRKKKLDCSCARMVTIDEGLCVQAMHVGPFDTEHHTVARMDAFLAACGCVNDMAGERRHHEIYLTDPRRTAPEKWKTVIRHPVRYET